MSAIKVRGVRIYYDESGSGEPVLLIPGVFGTAVYDFAAQLPELQKSFHVIAADPRGYGGSRPPVRDFPKSFHRRDADDLAALMKALGHKRYSVAGWSDGAIVGIFLASRYPNRVDKLVVCAANVSVDSNDANLLEYTRNLSVWSKDARRRVDYIDGAELSPLWNRYCDRLQAIARSGGEICVRRLAGIKCPCLILHGSGDATVSASHALKMKETIVNSSAWFIPGGGHDFPRTHSADVNPLMRDFLHTGDFRSLSKANAR